MADSISEQIKKSKSLIAKLEKAIADMEADGVDDDEKKRIEQNKSQIGQLKADLTKLEQQLEADKKEWNGLAGDLQTARDQLQTLKDWGGFDLAAIEGELTAIDGFAKAENYRDAITRLGEVKASLAKPYAEYTKQSEAKKKYDTDMPAFEARLTEAKNGKFQTDEVKKGTAQVEHNVPMVQQKAEVKDYVAANGLLEASVSELGLVEQQVVKAMEDDAAARKEYEPLQVKAADADKITHEELKDRVANAKSGTEKVGQMIDAFDFNGARSQIPTLSHEFDQIKAEAEKIDAAKKAEEEKKKKLKEEWERNAQRFQEIQKKVGELETFGSAEAKNLRALVSEIEGFVASEEYQFAIDGLAGAESALAKPYADYQVQQEAKKTYCEARPTLDTRAQTARGNKYADGDVGQMLNELDGDFSWMDGKDQERDYVQANTRIATATTKLDKIERALRDLEVRAQVAGEMGDVSSPEAEKEIKRRLYMQEQPPARERVDAAVKAEVLAEAMGQRLEQLASSLDGAESAAQAEDYAQALDAVRTVIDEMPTVEEAIRTQAEKKQLYEAALAEVKTAITSLQQSPHKRVQEETATLEGGIAEGESLAQAHDYEKALAKAQSLRGEVDRVRKMESDIAKDHAAADAALLEIQSRLDKALAKEGDAFKSGIDGLRAQKAEVDQHYADEDYAAALTSIGGLKELLVEFEKEAERQEQKELYDAALESLKVVQRLADATALGYPEADEQFTAADSSDKDRKSLADQEKYEEARTKAFDEAKALDAFDTRKGEIEAAKDQFEHNLPELQATIDDALKAPEDPKQASDDLVKAQDELREIKGRLDQAATRKCYIEAAKTSEEAKAKADEVIKLKFDLTPIDEPATVEFITSCVTAAATAFGAGANDAVLGFRIDVLESVTSERNAQAFSKWSGYALDTVAACASLAGPKGAIVAAVAAALKTSIAMGADASDAEDDAAEKAAAQSLISQLEQQAGQVAGTFNSGYAGTLKAGSKDKFDEIGRFCTRKEFPQARSALKGCGVPMDATPGAASGEFLKQLRAKFAASKRS